MKHILTSLALVILGHAVLAQTPTSAIDSVKSTSSMADGEVRKIDKENKKITLKHGVIKNLDMPGMTMVFQVKDVILLDNIKTGDKVEFTAENVNGVITVQSIKPKP